MTGAIEFLRKAKAICQSQVICFKCPLYSACGNDFGKLKNEADLVRKVMAYRLEDRDGKDA
jgi:hypothetical protein